MVSIGGNICDKRVELVSLLPNPRCFECVSFRFLEAFLAAKSYFCALIIERLPLSTDRLTEVIRSVDDCVTFFDIIPTVSY